MNQFELCGHILSCAVNCAMPSKQRGLSLSPVLFMVILYLQMAKHN